MFVFNQQLLDILCCPETKQHIAVIEKDIIDKINTKINEGGLKNRSGEEVKEFVDSGLIREDKLYMYPVRGGIPVMLIDQAIPLQQIT